MKTPRVTSIIPVLVVLSGLMWRLFGATLYVWSESPDPKPPYASWTTAARVIQDAVDAASAGDEIVVTNGVYATGGRAVDGAMTNRVAVTKAVTLRSVNGPDFTVIAGYQVLGTTNGSGAIRCVYLAEGARLSGFTLTKGATCTSGDQPKEQSGGGVYCASTNAVVTNCVLAGNTAAQHGGGAYGGTLYNCTVTRNSASQGGGLYRSTANNSIVYYNMASLGDNHFDSTLNYCCTWPLPAGGVGNIDADPQLVSMGHIAVTSPCRGAANAAYATGVDIDGEPWASPPSIGCDEVHPEALTGPLAATIQTSFDNVAVGYPLNLAGLVQGNVTANGWDFGDGTQATNRVHVTHAWTSPGDYKVTFTVFNDSHPDGVSTNVSIKVVEAVHYVSMGSVNPMPPYTSWATAATNIQDAVNAVSVAWATVLVGNGTYAAGDCRASDGSTNRVVVNKPLILRSVEGPKSTVIDGNGTMRCVYLANGAMLSGFTLTNGSAGNGGGVYAEPLGCIISNCVLTGNSASVGGGAYGSTLYNCALTGNSATRSGGGAYGSTVYNCTVAGNRARSDGGGAYGSTLCNCTLTGNSAWYGGGACNSTLCNCTVTGNSACVGGGLEHSSAYNSIVCYNRAAYEENHSASTLNYCCTRPLPSGGVGNIDADPRLVSLEHIALSSPCRGAGSGAYSTGVDIDGEPWASPPSIGCDEVHLGPLTGPLSPTIWAGRTSVGVGYPANLVGSITGPTTACAWDFGDGTFATNRGFVNHAWALAGDYTVGLIAYNDDHPEGVTASVAIKVVEAVHYVSANNVNPVPPYTSWATAATNIQDAVDAAIVAGATVLVGSGKYATGQKESQNIESREWELNRLVAAKPLIVKSFEGPETTIIDGNGEIRCVYLANGAMLSGFTLTNGRAKEGGGVYAEPSRCVITNCVLTGNSAEAGGGATWGGGAYGSALHNCIIGGNSAVGGGGAYLSALYNCTLTGNSAEHGGGASASTLYNCTLTGNLGQISGGGASYSTLYNCTLTGNRAGSGGGAWRGTLYNCTLTVNAAGATGGGADDSALYNCTLTGNSARNGGGAYDSTLYNCIVYFNRAPNRPNHYEATLNYCCTTPLPTNGIGNIGADPRFVNAAAGDFRLLPDSPCIDAGTNLTDSVSTDIVGLPRPLDGNGDGVARFDIGAYEFNPYRFARLVFDQFTFNFTIQGEPGRSVRLERSRDLANWEEAAVLPLPASGQTLFDAGAIMEPYLFYRAVLAP